MAKRTKIRTRMTGGHTEVMVLVKHRGNPAKELTQLTFGIL